ncbi:MAG: pyridoxal phosphate-dependent aminotransferase [Pseudomonadota bacterium]
MIGPRLTEIAESLPASVPFVGPEAQERALDRPFAARIGANESVFGPSPLAIEAMARAAADAWMYGDPEMHDLRGALADHLGLRPENIMIGEGIDGLLGVLARLIVSPGDAVVTSDGAYPTFNYHVAGFGGALHKVPYRDDKEDLAALLAKASDVGAKLIYLANPDNPMGSWHPATAISDTITTVPEGAVLALDEAYSDTAPPGTIPAIDPDERRVVRFRTFSKAYGLAGLRVGYAIGHADTIRAFNKVRNHFGVGRVAQAGALAALKDQDYLQATIARIAAACEGIAEIARGHGLTPLPTAANFVTIDCGRDADFARSVLETLVENGIFVRMPFAEPGNRAIRVSAGLPEDLAAFDKALPLALAAAARICD